MIRSEEEETFHHFTLIQQATRGEEVHYELVAGGWLIGASGELLYKFGPFAHLSQVIGEAETALHQWAKSNGLTVKADEDTRVNHCARSH